MLITKEMLELDRKTMSVKEIAKKYNKGERTISTYLKDFGLTKATNRVDINDVDVLADYDMGLTINEIALKYNASHDTITKRLNKYNIKNTRVAGIKRHFAKTYDDRWSDIKKDFDMGLSKTYIRNKHKIRMENLEDLMQKNGYLTANEAYKNRILTKHQEFEKAVSQNKRYRFVFNYLNKLLDYYDIYHRIPTRREFSDFIGVRYTNVCLTVKKYNLSSLFVVNSISSYADIIKQKLDEFNIKYNINNRNILGKKELDFYLPDYRLGIEVNPYKYHCVEHLLNKDYHQEKALLAREKNIGLVHIYDDDMKNLDKIFDYITREIKYHIGARKCVCKFIDGKTAKHFYDIYHLQKSCNSHNTIHIGLYYQDILVSAISIAKHRYNKEYNYELIRYAVNYEYAVSGGFLKMLKFARYNGISGKLATYVDLDKRLRSKNVYALNGFKYVGLTQPSYIWVNSSLNCLSRYQVQKLNKNHQTERDLMHDLNYVQVYKSGSLIYEIQL